MEENYEQFTPGEVVKKVDFDFVPSRFQIWEKGEIIDSGNLSSVLEARVIMVDGAEKMEVSYHDKNLKGLVAKSQFDRFLTAHDRLQLFTIPRRTNTPCMGITALLWATGGPTRDEKDFQENEPYCCSIFIARGTFQKITFSISNPEKLIEFYK